MCGEFGTLSVVSPQNWLFLGRYQNLRQKLLTERKWHTLARLGPRAFETITGEVVKAILLTVSNDPNAQRSGELFDDDAVSHSIGGIDVSNAPSADEKSRGIRTSEVVVTTQAMQLKNPDHVVSVQPLSSKSLLSEFATALSGSSAGDAPSFNRQFWEVTDHLSGNWRFHHGTVKSTSHFGGQDEAIHWENEAGRMAKFAASVKHLNHAAQNWLRGKPNWNKPGVVISQMGDLPATIFTGEIYDCNACAIVPNETQTLPALWEFARSGAHAAAVRDFDQSLKVTPHNLLKVEFDFEYWDQLAAKSYPNGLPKPFSNDATQWIFHGHPCGSVVWDEDANWTANGPLRNDDTVLHVAVARLLGYRWPAELDPDMELAHEQRAWVDRCDALLHHADDDGIVCIPPIRGEAKAEDRLLNLLAAAYGDAWTTSTLPQLLASANHAGKSLDSWLRDKFFAQHCKLFQHRPFIWHIWDGLKDGFAALVNYHKLDRKSLEMLIYTYLGDWMKTQRDDIARGVDGAQEKLAAAEALKKKLELILGGESPHDIFVRWKPLEEQPIGWDPDLNDGVRLNIRPFMTVGDVSKRDAGVLPDKPNVHWNKDRGKDVASAPWFDTFNGERINEHHLSLAEKKAAREAAK